MRRAEESDQVAVEELVVARARWMTERGVRGGSGWERSAGELARQGTKPDASVWVLVSAAGRVVGRTTLGDQTPLWGWTDEEQAQSAYLLNTTVTDPAFAGQGLGTLIAWWALDRAAAHGRQWVRRSVGPDPGLLRYYCQVQGWRVFHHVQRHGQDAYLLGREAEAVPELGERLRTAE